MKLKNRQKMTEKMCLFVGKQIGYELDFISVLIASIIFLKAIVSVLVLLRMLSQLRFCFAVNSQINAGGVALIGW